MKDQTEFGNTCSFQRNKNNNLIRHLNIDALLLIWIIGLSPIPSLAQPLAPDNERFIGNIIGNGYAIRSDFSNYWNQVTAENAGKWASVEDSQDVYNWTELDNIYNYAIADSFPYKHHALVWGNQCPSWITSLDSASQRAEVEEWIDSVGTRYPDIDFVDVVNEPFNAPPPYLQALGGNGTTGWDWVITAFQWARQYCAPKAKLLLNEYNVLHSDSITDNYLALIDTLKVRGLIDGIGIQGHYFEFKSYQGATPVYAYPISKLQYNLDRLAATSLPIYISEFDINEADDDIQLENYQTYFPLFWEHPAVKGITLWGYVEGEIWKQNAYLIDWRGAERPALPWLRTYLVSPFPPALISPVSTGNVPRNAILLWHSSASATSYQVQLATNSTFTSIVVDSIVVDTLLQLDPLAANARFYWRVSASNDQGTSRYSTVASFMTGDQIIAIYKHPTVPTEFKLYQNFPNPFNSSTNIPYYLPKNIQVRLTVYNTVGQSVRNLLNQRQNSGMKQVEWDGRDNGGRHVASGIYFYKVETDDFIQIKKMLLAR
jgi:endo-1,4-beta-xylanase